MPERIDKYLKKGLPPVLLVFGEEEYLVDGAVDKIAAFGRSVSEFDFEIIDAGESTIERIIEGVKTYPFVSEKRIVIVKNFDALFAGTRAKKSDEKSPLAKYLDEPSTYCSLTLVGAPDSLNGLSAGKSKSEKILKSLKFPFSTIINKHEYVEFPKVWESDFPDWITKRLKSEGYEIEPKALELLSAQVNPSLRELANELEKLKIYLKDKRKITADDVSQVVGVSREYNVFELQKAVGRRDLPAVMNIIERMLESDRQEMLIIAMLTRYFIALWKLSDENKPGANQYQLAASVGVNAYFLNEYLAALKNYKPEELDRAIIELAEADERLKSSSTDSVYVLQRMLIAIMDVRKSK